MSELLEIKAQPRADMGKGASRRLRREGLVPGIIYGARKDPELVSFVHTDLLQHLDHEAFYSSILTLKVEDRSVQVILKDLQRHPAKPFLLHVDFQRVSATEKLRTRVPLHFIGEDDAPAVKGGGGVSHLQTDIEVSCLPGNLPEYVDVDVSGLDVGDTILLSGLVLPEGVELVGADNDVPVAQGHALHTTEVETPVEEEGGEEAPPAEEE
ncbi:MAG TPA: 50S ribosomal protein L25/general stress protein Ctc [Sedimenticola sp.]|nr:50S ribosomal protein L25/general stress protein Ctc [Sedimenticola sp.]